MCHVLEDKLNYSNAVSSICSDFLIILYYRKDISTTTIHQSMSMQSGSLTHFVLDAFDITQYLICTFCLHLNCKNRSTYNILDLYFKTSAQNSSSSNAVRCYKSKSQSLIAKIYNTHVTSHHAKFCCLLSTPLLKTLLKLKYF